MANDVYQSKYTAVQIEQKLDDVGSLKTENSTQNDLMSSLSTNTSELESVTNSLSNENSTQNSHLNSLSTENSLQTSEITSLSTAESELSSEVEMLGSEVAEKQDSLTAGDNITITNNVIEATGNGALDLSKIIPPGTAHNPIDGTPVGTILSFFGDNAPDGYLTCDGSVYNKVDYPFLAAHLLNLSIASQFVVDGDDTKFKVPDLRGEFLRGTGTNSHTNQGNGANVGVHQNATQIPYTFISSDNRAYTRLGSRDTSTPINPDKTINGTQYEYSVEGSKSSVNYTPMDYTSRPTNTSVLYCIKYN